MLTEIKNKMRSALLARDELRKNILRVVVGEIETEASRHGELNDERCVSIIRKVIASNDETIAAGANNPDQLRSENEILCELLPKTLSQEEIEVFLGSIEDNVRLAKNSGAAMGIAMKALKGEGKVVLGDDVKVVVEKMRA